MTAPGLHHRAPAGFLERLSAIALVFSLVLVAWVGVRYARTAPLPTASDAAASELRVTLGARDATTTGRAIRMVAADPFHVDRLAPAARYLLPEDGTGTTVSGPGPLRPGAVRLLGTAVLGGGGSFVMCQVGSATPQVVRVGERVGDLTLVSVSRGEAEFTRRDGETVVLAVPTAVGVTGGPGERPR